MTRVLLVYESKYGNTKLVAKTIAEGVREVGGSSLPKRTSPNFGQCSMTATRRNLASFLGENEGSLSLASAPLRFS